mmetsp:Transcript_20795/g.30784  ORF Transcript_20795/g.30784 Transcript_20795/m.30784 type:complete len:94 (-) Transcript_20795:545-826(-)
MQGGVGLGLFDGAKLERLEGCLLKEGAGEGAIVSVGKKEGETEGEKVGVDVVGRGLMVGAAVMVGVEDGEGLGLGESEGKLVGITPVGAAEGI